MTKNFFFLTLIVLCPLLASGQVVDDSQEDLPWNIRHLRQLKHAQDEILWDKQPQSYLEVGKAYFSGKGVKKNFSKAEKYLKKAAAKGLPEAQLLVALIPVYREKPKASQAQLEKSFQTVLSLAKQDYPLAQYYTYQLYMQGKGTATDPQQALHWLNLAATAPVPAPQAQTELANYYYYGFPPYLQKDLQKAFTLFLAAAQSDDTTAYYNVAIMYLQGQGTEKNEKRAFHFMRQAARARNPIAQLELSRMYHQGIGTAQDDANAFNWALLAAKNGYTPAQEQTAFYWLQGIGTRKNRREAMFWAVRAQNNGSEKAADIIKQIQQEL